MDLLFSAVLLHECPMFESRLAVYVRCGVSTWSECMQEPTNKYQAPSWWVLCTKNTSCNFYIKMTHKTLQHTAKNFKSTISAAFFILLLFRFFFLSLFFISFNFVHSFVVIGINFCLGFLVFNDDERGCWWLLPGWIVLRLVLTALLQLNATVFVETRVVRWLFSTAVCMRIFALENMCVSVPAHILKLVRALIFQQAWAKI